MQVDELIELLDKHPSEAVVYMWDREDRRYVPVKAITATNGIRVGPRVYLHSCECDTCKGITNRLSTGELVLRMPCCKPDPAQPKASWATDNGYSISHTTKREEWTYRIHDGIDVIALIDDEVQAISIIQALGMLRAKKPGR